MRRVVDNNASKFLLDGLTISQMKLHAHCQRDVIQIPSETAAQLGNGMKLPYLKAPRKMNEVFLSRSFSIQALHVKVCDFSLTKLLFEEQSKS